MHEREAIIRPWFDMWLRQQDPGYRYRLCGKRGLHGKLGAEIRKPRRRKALVPRVEHQRKYGCLGYQAVFSQGRPDGCGVVLQGQDGGQQHG